MAIFKCKMCGADLEIVEDSKVCECEYCGSTQTIPSLDNEKKINLFTRANRLRMACEFDKAAGVYENIVSEFQDEAEAYWGIILCKYGIEYVDDPKTGKKIPTCHRSSFDSVMEDSNFEMVMECGDIQSRLVYREEAKTIEKLRTDIIEVSSKEEPYDIFICYKETDEHGDRTIDSVIAQDVYDALTEKGYKVFFSRITLEDKLGQEYEPYIFAALNSAKVMLAFGTDYEYYNAVWVKNEWSRFLSLIEKGEKKTLIPCYKDIDAYDMPNEFKRLQAQDMGKVGAIQDLLRGIEKIIGKKNESISINNNTYVNNIVTNAEALVKRGFIFLEDEEYESAETYFENALNEQPENAEAYMGKLCVYYKVKNMQCFAEYISNKLMSLLNSKYLIKVDYDSEKIINDEFVYANQINSSIRKSLIKTLSEPFVNVNLDILNESNEIYLEKFCKQDKEAFKLYSKFEKYSTAELKNKYSIEELIINKLSNEIEKNKKIVLDAKNFYTQENISKFMRQLSLLVKEVHESELESIEKEFQEKLLIWEEHKKQREEEWNDECERIRIIWPIECKSIINEWETTCRQIDDKYEEECQKIKSEYDKRKAEYDDAMSKYLKDKNLYEENKRDINSNIENLNNEIKQSNSIFKINKKKELESQLAIWKMKLFNLKEPEKSQLLLNEIPAPVYPTKPDYPLKPVLNQEPTLPVLEVEEKPIKRTISTNFFNIVTNHFVTNHLLKENGIKNDYFVEFGRYEIDGKVIQLKWIVIDERDNEKLLLSSEVIGFRNYNEKFEAVNWKECSLRKWLNEEFMRKAFSDVEITQMRVVKNENLDNSKYKTAGGESTSDRIICLSENEVNELLFDKEFRISKLLGDNSESYVEWWLRTPGFNLSNASIVTGEGVVDLSGKGVFADNIGVRPAIWVNKSYTI